MLTFLEFYQTLLQFVNYKLYHGLAVHYPPVLDSKLEQAAAGLASIMQDIAQHQPHKPAIQEAATHIEVDTRTDAATLDLQALPPAVQERLQRSQAAATAASDEEGDEEVGEIDSGDEDRGSEASSLDEEADVGAAAEDAVEAAAVPHTATGRHQSLQYDQHSLQHWQCLGYGLSCLQYVSLSFVAAGKE